MSNTEEQPLLNGGRFYYRTRITSTLSYARWESFDLGLSISEYFIILVFILLALYFFFDSIRMCFVSLDNSLAQDQLDYEWDGSDIIYVFND